MNHQLSAFAQRVYQLCREIPVGRVTTYRLMAEALSSSPRAVGQALRRNPYAPEVPCHRVVSSDGRLGGFMGAAKGDPIRLKIERLAGEGIEIQDGSVVAFAERLHCFPQAIQVSERF